MSAISDMFMIKWRSHSGITKPLAESPKSLLVFPAFFLSLLVDRKKKRKQDLVKAGPVFYLGNKTVWRQKKKF